MRRHLGLRLAGHLWQRLKSEQEDGRYAYLRAYWNNDAVKLFIFFQMQAGLVALFSFTIRRRGR